MTVLGGLCVKERRGVSALLEGLEKEAGIQPASQPNPSLRPKSGQGLTGDAEAGPSVVNPQQMKTDSSHHLNCV